MNKDNVVRKRWAYIDKRDVKEFFFVLPSPADLGDAYRNCKLSIHNVIAEVVVRRTFEVWKVRAKCLADGRSRHCPKCEENSKKHGGRNIPHLERRRDGHYFVLFPVQKSSSGKESYAYANGQEPMVNEYRYRYDREEGNFVCDEWNSLVYAINDAIKDGRDPFSQTEAVIFRASATPQSFFNDSGEEVSFTVWQHEYVKGVSIPMPKAARAKIEAHSPLGELALGLNADDMETIIRNAQEFADAAARRLPAQRFGEIYNAYYGVSNQNFINVLRSKEQAKSNAPDAAGPRSTAYSRQSNVSAASSRGREVSEDRKQPTPSAPAASPPSPKENVVASVATVVESQPPQGQSYSELFSMIRESNAKATPPNSEPGDRAASAEPSVSETKTVAAAQEVGTKVPSSEKEGLKTASPVSEEKLASTPVVAKIEQPQPMVVKPQAQVKPQSAADVLLKIRKKTAEKKEAVEAAKEPAQKASNQ